MKGCLRDNMTMVRRKQEHGKGLYEELNNIDIHMCLPMLGGSHFFVRIGWF
jgi:hypothetical protein